MAKRQPPSDNASERQKIIATVMEWQEPAAWKIAFGLGAKFHKYKASAAENRELASKYPDEAIWAKAAERAERATEIYHQQIVEKHGKLLEVKNYLRLNEPDLLPLVPIVDFFGEQPADVLSLAKSMELVESALRVRTAQPGGDQAAADGDAAMPAQQPAAGGKAPGTPPSELAQREGVRAEVKNRLIKFLIRGVSDREKALLQLEEIICSDQTVNEMLREFHKIVPINDRSCAELAELLGVSKVAIVKSEWWQQNVQEPRKREAQEREDRLRDDGKLLG
jgi:hypothetical protein